MNEMTDVYLRLAKKLRGEGDDIVQDGESVRVPLQLMDAQQREVVAIKDGLETNDAVTQWARRRTDLSDAEQARLADARRTAEAAYEERKKRDANSWRAPGSSRVATADTAKVVDVRSLSVEDARAAREQAWHQRNERDRNAWRQPPRPVSLVRDFRPSQPASRAPQQDASPALDPRTTPLAELRRAADKARAERDERDRNAWRRTPSPYLVSVQKAATELQNADDPIAKAQAAENLRIATVGGRGA